MASPRSSVSLTLIMQTTLTKDEVQARYDQGALEAYESTQLLILPVKEALAHAQSSATAPLKEGEEPLHMTAALRGSLQLLDKYLKKHDGIKEKEEREEKEEEKLHQL
eukprot:jgi/Bigna1/138494/aug1.45_g13202